ncbi:tyrosine-type recombinase/integrase [Agathobaculum sp.]|uniref:tyrosine-type recombinase/integrase n=1 Tax=Agathobaculum sp. TaxID=2048138 RepID=UPI003AB7F75F
MVFACRVFALCNIVPCIYRLCLKANDGIGRPITEDERQHILNVCRTHKHGFWVLFMLYTGARPVETRLAKWEDVDLDNNRITIHSAKNNFGDRLVPINPELLPYLTCGDGYIFPQDDDQTQATRGSLRSWWKGFKRAVDIDMGAQVSVRGGVIPVTSKVAPDLVPYCLRHTCATDWYTAGVPINTIREFMGHNDISTTTRVYVKLSDEAFNDAAARIAAFEQGKKEHKILIIPREQEMTS